MSHEDHLEDLLARTPGPRVVAGAHRAGLKARLLQSMRKERPVKTIWKPLLVACAVVCCAVVLIAAGGWAAEKVYERITKKEQYVELERFEEPPVTLPDGTTMGSVSVTGTYLPADAPPGSAEKAKKDHEEMKQLIAKRQYELVKTFEGGGGKQYVYRFTLSDGTSHGMNFSIPLENVTSWEDYCQKSREQKRQREESIFKAFAAGRFRLIDIDRISVYVCRDADSDTRYLVQRFPRPDGEDEALVRPEGAGATRYKTSWKDHLETVRQGKRVLLDVRVTKSYIYEVTLDDGSTTTYQIGVGADASTEELEERLRQRAAIMAGKGQ